MHPHFRSFASRDEGAGTVAALEQGPVTIRLSITAAGPRITYPQNPHGSPLGIPGLTSADRRQDPEAPRERSCRREVSYCGSQRFERNLSRYTLDSSVAEMDCEIIYHNWYGK
jgi:hypothetical protein